MRVVLTLFDSVEHADQQLPRRFAWMPSLLAVLRVQHADDLTRQMLARLWRELHTQGFWPSASLRAAVEPGLTEWIASCLRHRSAAGVPLRAAVRPQTPLCLYLHGEAGSGKSSFVRALLPALAATLRAHLDPELAAHAVKQTLNKPLDALQLEFERRPTTTTSPSSTSSPWRASHSQAPRTGPSCSSSGSKRCPRPRRSRRRRRPARQRQRQRQRQRKPRCRRHDLRRRLRRCR